MVRAGCCGRGRGFILLASGGRSDCRALATWLDPHDYFSYRPGAKKFQNKLLEYDDNVNGQSRKLRPGGIHGGWLWFFGLLRFCKSLNNHTRQPQPAPGRQSLGKLLFRQFHGGFT